MRCPITQGLDDTDTELIPTLRTAYEEWLDSQKGVTGGEGDAPRLGVLGTARSARYG